MKKRDRAAFTLVETLVVISISILLAAMTVPAWRYFQKKSSLKNSVEEIISAVRLTQNKTLASEQSSKWGIWFSSSTNPNQYVIFKGENYASREPGEDIITDLNDLVEIYDLSLAEGGSEIVFERVTGDTKDYGTVSLRLKSDPSENRQIIIESSGRTSSQTGSSPNDLSRIKDSRHVHFDYDRQIDTGSEIITLTFFYNASSVERDIIIADNLRGGQIDWEGETNVNGDMQKIKIHTHLLNDVSFGTQFCIHRDRRYNDKALTIEISGDSSVDLLQYDADGNITQGTSIYVSEPDPQ